MKGSSTLYSSSRQTWRTPNVVLDCIREMGTIGLDPCADDDPANHFALFNLTLATDGLSVRWQDTGLVYINPPYNTAAAWAEHAVSDAEEGAEIIMLIPARTDTRMWHHYIFPTCSAICFWRGRIKFEGAEQGAPFPSALAYWGTRTPKFERAFESRGSVWM